MMLRASLALLALLALSGCDLTRFFNDAQASGLQRGAPALQEHWDYELAGETFPNNIIQTEGRLRISPENEFYILSAIRLYTSYAFGWIEDRVEQLREDGDYAGANVQLERARYMYLRALELAKHLLKMDHEGFDEAYQEGPEAFAQWLQDEFDEEEDAAILFWVGYSWGSYMNASMSDMAELADLPYAEAMITRSVELDPAYYNSSGSTFLAVIETRRPGGADLDAALVKWERVIALTERRNLLVLVNMAKTYAVARGDRELYLSLLTEVLESGDVEPENRLATMIAKRRAARYFRQVNERFPTAIPTSTGDEAPAVETSEGAEAEASAEATP